MCLFYSGMLYLAWYKKHWIYLKILIILRKKRESFSFLDRSSLTVTLTPNKDISRPLNVNKLYHPERNKRLLYLYVGENPF